MFQTAYLKKVVESYPKVINFNKVKYKYLAAKLGNTFHCHLFQFPVIASSVLKWLLKISFDLQMISCLEYSRVLLSDSLSCYDKNLTI